MKKVILVLIFLNHIFFSCNSDKKDNTSSTPPIVIDSISVVDKKPISEIKIKPINHASFILEYEDIVVYVDPVGGAALYKDEKPPSAILITDIHGDHFDLDTFLGVMTDTAQPVVPYEVAAKIPDSVKYNMIALKNEQSVDYTKAGLNLVVYAKPMYNLREEALKYHEKGRGNGYVVTMGGKRIYISGDTEDIPEMRHLSNIDIAFVCMNLPYTMTVESAASAVLDFKPKKVYPYHYKGPEGFSDIEKFKTLINEGNKDIEVVVLDWYKTQ